jgi:hypothetical protein
VLRDHPPSSISRHGGLNREKKTDAGFKSQGVLAVVFAANATAGAGLVW